MKAPLDAKHAMRRLVDSACELYSSADAGGRGTVDLGCDARGSQFSLVRAPEYSEASGGPPAVRLWVRVRDAAGVDVTPADLNPVLVVGAECADDVLAWLGDIVRLSVGAI